VQQLLQWKSNKYYIFWACVGSLEYPACNAHASYDMSSVACPAVQYFSTLFHKQHDYLTQVIEHEMRVAILSETFLILRSWARYDQKCIFGLHVKYALFLSDFNGTWTFSTDFSKKYSNIEFHENALSGSRVVPCGRTDLTKLIVAFRNFAKAPKN
jgi:hypothetical protein